MTTVAETNRAAKVGLTGLKRSRRQPDLTWGQPPPVDAAWLAIQKLREVTRDKDVTNPYALFDLLLEEKAYWDDVQADLERTLLPYFLAVFLAGMSVGEVVASKAAPVPSDETLAQRAERAIRAYLPTFARGIVDTTYAAVKEAVLAARKAGTGVQGVMDAIAHLFDPRRAQQIAVTEITNLFGLGAQEAYRAQGMWGWEWTTVVDPRVCPMCKAREGRKFPQATAFSSLHPSCRCFPKPVLNRPTRAVAA